MWRVCLNIFLRNPEAFNKTPTCLGRFLKISLSYGQGGYFLYKEEIMTLQETLNYGVKKLNEKKIEDSLIITKELMQYVLKADRQFIVAHLYEEILQKDETEFERYIDKIIEGYPIQYITHKQNFMNEEYYVDENVLIPQPDTEILVEETIKKCKQGDKILDLCTGSGAIAISLKKALDRKNIPAKIFASDISKEAINVAKKNAEKNYAPIITIRSDLFDNITENDFNIIASNPPYIKTQVIKALSKQVKNEPYIALNGGEDGLDFYKKIAQEAYKFIKNDGFLCLEIGYDQAKEVSEILEENKFYKNIQIVKDLGQNDRCIICKIEKE